MRGGRDDEARGGDAAKEAKRIEKVQRTGEPAEQRGTVNNAVREPAGERAGDELGEGVHALMGDGQQMMDDGEGMMGGG